MRRCIWSINPWHATPLSEHFCEDWPYLASIFCRAETVSASWSHPPADPVPSWVAHCWPLEKPVSLPHSWLKSWPLLPRRVRAVRCGSGFPCVHALMWQSRFCPLFGRVFRIIYPTAIVYRCPLKFLVNRIKSAITRTLPTWTPRFPPTIKDAG